MRSEEKNRGQRLEEAMTLVEKKEKSMMGELFKLEYESIKFMHSMKHKNKKVKVRDLEDYNDGLLSKEKEKITPAYIAGLWRSDRIVFGCVVGKGTGIVSYDKNLLKKLQEKYGGTLRKSIELEAYDMNQAMKRRLKRERVQELKAAGKNPKKRKSKQ